MAELAVVAGARLAGLGRVALRSLHPLHEFGVTRRALRLQTRLALGILLGEHVDFPRCGRAELTAGIEGLRALTRRDRWGRQFAKHSGRARGGRKWGCAIHIGAREHRGSRLGVFHAGLPDTLGLGTARRLLLGSALPVRLPLAFGLGVGLSALQDDRLPLGGELGAPGATPGALFVARGAFLGALGFGDAAGMRSVGALRLAPALLGGASLHRRLFAATALAFRRGPGSGGIDLGRVGFEDGRLEAEAELRGRRLDLLSSGRGLRAGRRRCSASACGQPSEGLRTPQSADTARRLDPHGHVPAGQELPGLCRDVLERRCKGITRHDHLGLELRELRGRGRGRRPSGGHWGRRKSGLRWVDREMAGLPCPPCFLP